MYKAQDSDAVNVYIIFHYSNIAHSISGHPNSENIKKKTYKSNIEMKEEPIHLILRKQMLSPKTKDPNTLMQNARTQSLFKCFRLYFYINKTQIVSALC